MGTNLDDLIRWYVGTRRGYYNLDPRKVDPNGAYFLFDTREIVLDDTVFTGILLFYSGEKPLHPARNRIYMNIDTLEVSTYNNGRWYILYGPGNSELFSADPAILPTEQAVTGEPVVNFVDRLIDTTISDMGTFYYLNYNENTHKLEFEIGDNSGKYLITEIGNRLVYDSNTRELMMLDTNNVALSKFVLFPRHMIRGVFNNVDRTIDFSFSDAEPIIKVPVAQMFNLLDAETTATMISSTTRPGKYLEMRVRRSYESGNLLEQKTDGIFFTYTRFVDLIQPGFENIILHAESPSGNLVPRGKYISTRPIERYGTSITNINAVVTEEVVWNAVKDIMKPYAKYSDVIPTLAPVEALFRVVTLN